jgi:hypothetical protein
MPVIENLTRSEKLRMMEALWDNLVHNKAGLASPAWHAETLKKAEQALSSGKANFID